MLAEMRMGRRDPIKSAPLEHINITESLRFGRCRPSAVRNQGHLAKESAIGQHRHPLSLGAQYFDLTALYKVKRITGITNFKDLFFGHVDAWFELTHQLF